LLQFHNIVILPFMDKTVRLHYLVNNNGNCVGSSCGSTDVSEQNRGF